MLIRLPILIISFLICGCSSVKDRIFLEPHIQRIVCSRNVEMPGSSERNNFCVFYNNSNEVIIKKDYSSSVWNERTKRYWDFEYEYQYRRTTSIGGGCPEGPPCP